MSDKRKLESDAQRAEGIVMFTPSRRVNTTQALDMEETRCSDTLSGSSPVPEKPSIVPTGPSFTDNSEGLTGASIRAALDVCSTVEKSLSPTDLVLSGTWARYMKTVGHLMREGRGDPYTAYQAMRAQGCPRSTQQGRRSALIRHAVLSVRTYAPTVLNLTDPFSLEAVLGDLTESERTELSQATTFLLAGDADLRPALEAPKSTPTEPCVRRQGSKRKALTAILRLERRRQTQDPTFDWRSLVWSTSMDPPNGIDFETRLLLAITMVTGCRPAELVHLNGMLFNVTDADRLKVRLAGAKAFRPPPGIEMLPKGQVWRSLELSVEMPEARWLRDHLRQGLDLGRLPAWITSSVGGSIRLAAEPIAIANGQRHPCLTRFDKKIARIGRLAFPRLEARLTPYIFRHAFASDLKAHGFCREEIAMALGHISRRTQSAYGHKRQGRTFGSRGGKILTIEASDAVRSPGAGQRISQVQPNRSKQAP